METNKQLNDLANICNVFGDYIDIVSLILSNTDKLKKSEAVVLTDRLICSLRNANDYEEMIYISQMCGNISDRVLICVIDGVSWYAYEMTYMLIITNESEYYQISRC